MRKADPVYKDFMKKDLTPKVPLLRAEMRRRAKQRGIDKFRNKSLLRLGCLQWLKNNPVVDKTDIVFLRKTEKEYYATLLAARNGEEQLGKEKLD